MSFTFLRAKRRASNARALLNWGPLFIFLGAMLWATDAPFRVALLKDASPSLVVLCEHLLNAALLFPLLVARRKEVLSMSRQEWAAVGIIAVGGSAIATFAFTSAFAYVNPSVAILLQKLQPIIVILLAYLFLGERMGKRFWPWALLALASAYVLSFPSFIPRLYEGETLNPNVIGVSFALLAAALWGASTVCGRRALRRLDVVTLTGLRFVIAFVFLFVWTASTGELASIVTLTLRDWILLAIVACASGSVSLLLYYRGLKSTKASVATLAELGFPLASVLINFLFLDAALLPAQIIAMIFLLLSVLMLSREHM